MNSLSCGDIIFVLSIWASRIKMLKHIWTYLRRNSKFTYFSSYIWMWTKQSMKSKQTRRTLTHNVPIFHVGLHIWQPWAFNEASLCICQLFCSSGTLTHCGSLSLWSDQCCLSLQCSNQWNTSQTQLHPEKPQQPWYIHMSIIPHWKLPSKCQWSCNQREETKNTKGSCNFFLLGEVSK